MLTGDTTDLRRPRALRGLRQALRGRGVAIDPDYVVDARLERERGGYSGMLQLLSLPEPPTAVYLLQLQHGRRAPCACSRSTGFRIPDDISLVSFDDVPLFRLHEAGITAVAQPVDKIAETIAGLLTSRLSESRHRHAPHTIMLDCDIILRGSTRRLLTPRSDRQPEGAEMASVELLDVSKSYGAGPVIENLSLAIDDG